MVFSSSKSGEITMWQMARIYIYTLPSATLDMISKNASSVAKKNRFFSICTKDKSDGKTIPGVNIFINTSSSNNLSFNSSLIWSGTTGTSYAPKLFDINRDGINDVLSGSKCLLSNSTSITTTSFTDSAFTGGDFFTFVGIGDISGDGYPELIRTGSGYTYTGFHWNNFSSANGSLSSFNYLQNYPMEGGAKPKIIDIDGDNKKDIIVANDGATSKTYFSVFRNRIGEDPTITITGTPDFDSDSE